jgi:hypothetical protein
MRSVIMLSVIMLSVVMPNIVMLIVVAPFWFTKDNMSFFPQIIHIRLLEGIGNKLGFCRKTNYCLAELWGELVSELCNFWLPH